MALIYKTRETSVVFANPRMPSYQRVYPVNKIYFTRPSMWLHVPIKKDHGPREKITFHIYYGDVKTMKVSRPRLEITYLELTLKNGISWPDIGQANARQHTHYRVTNLFFSLQWSEGVSHTFSSHLKNTYTEVTGHIVEQNEYEAAAREYEEQLSQARPFQYTRRVKRKTREN